ncbi:class II aaRS and biotin synthetase [Hygrophoropsis aurantiaca]|uniref:Class II aaRS and biotin synthetase n=1 Tax=Hygrophoropsis aurantiaca TaxID=72124 RepID=A0ACB8ADL7_9AGAM|nr:class II aaRS and biotin synthetase [Hygrophoropsis aurantiaca]
MDILIYPEEHSSSSELKQLIKDLVTPHYTAQTLPHTLFSVPEHPWQTSCALLILLAIPNDSTVLKKYTNNGGRILALGAHVKVGSGILELTSSSRFASLGLGLGLSSNGEDPGSFRLTDDGESFSLSFPLPSSPTLTVVQPDNISVCRVPHARLDIPTEEDRILGRYTEDHAVAGVLLRSKKVALWSCAPPLATPLLEQSLSALGMSLPGTRTVSLQRDRDQSAVLPQILLANPMRWSIQRHIMDAIFPSENVQRSFSRLKGDNICDKKASGSLDITSAHKGLSELLLKDANDNFCFHYLNSFPNQISAHDHPLYTVDLRCDADSDDKKTKHIIVPVQPLTPSEEMTFTPHFSPNAFFNALNELNSREKPSIDTPWNMGDALLYGEAVTSTQTMLDKNPKLLRSLPSPLLSFATTQLAGRGRGANTWVSPTGCLQMSLRLQVKLKGMDASGIEPSIRPSNLVFIQYLYALAVVEACHALDPVSRGWAADVRLKWPNDIYGMFPDHQGRKKELRKLGGVLVNTSFGSGIADVIIGCGLNLLNEPPIASLAQLTPSSTTPPYLTVEHVAAAILSTFEDMWAKFLAHEERGFESFMGLYLERWLHSDQLVTLTTTTPQTDVRIVGITSDHGLLRTVPVVQEPNSRASPNYIDLQPDGNSFDMMKGLIKAKTS